MPRRRAPAAVAGAAAAIVATLCLTPQYSAHAAGDTTITTVHYVTSAHLDVGFADTAPAIVERWWYHHFPYAQNVSDALRENAPGVGQPRMKMMVQPWLVWLYFNCPGGEGGANALGVRCPTAAEQAAVRASIANGTLYWHAFPFNSEMEMYAPQLIREGIHLAHDLDKEFGFQPKVTMSQRDVPGTTRSLIPLLVDEGVQALSVGVNGASTPPDVPKAFVWQDPPSGKEILAMWHPGGYGGYDAGSIVTVPGLAHAFVMDFNGDNAGPYDPDTYVNHWRSVQKLFPKATLVASTFDDWTAVLQTARSQLPVVTSEFGDTWIYGVASDPRKVAMMRAMNRAWTAYAASTTPAQRAADPVYLNASRLAIKAGEHTWGGDVKLHLHDNVNWTNANMRRARADPKVGPQYTVLEDSWVRQRNWGVFYPLQALTDAKHPLGSAIEAEFAAMHPVTQPDPAALGFSRVQNVTAVFDAGAFSIGFDAGTGAITTLTDAATGVAWADASHPLAALQYTSYSYADVTEFIDLYLTAQPPPSWAFHDFGKPNASIANPVHMDLPSALHALWVKKPSAADSGVTSFLAQMTVADPTSPPPPSPRVAHEQYGAPAEVWLAVDVPARGAGTTVNISMSLLNKTATRLPEACFVRFLPSLGAKVSTGSAPQQWEVNKLGEWISTADVVSGGAKHLHAVQDGARFNATGSAAGHSLIVAPVDAAVMAAGKPSGYPTPINVTADTATYGVSSLLFDNVWGTNYIMWAGSLSAGTPSWGADDNLLFRYAITST